MSFSWFDSLLEKILQNSNKNASSSKVCRDCIFICCTFTWCTIPYVMSHQNKCLVEYTANAHCNKLELHYMNIVLLNISVSNNLNWIQPMNWLQIGRRTGNMVKWSTLQKIISNHNLFRWLMLHLWNEKLSVIFCSQAAFQKTAETFGGIDIVCNNAGILNETEWEKTVSINLVRSCKSNKLHLVVIMPCMPNMLNS